MEGDRWPVDGCDHSAVGTTGQAEQTAVGAQTEGEGKSALRGVFQGRGWWERDPGLGWVFPAQGSENSGGLWSGPTLRLHSIAGFSVSQLREGLRP